MTKLDVVNTGVTNSEGRLLGRVRKRTRVLGREEGSGRLGGRLE